MTSGDPPFPVKKRWSGGKKSKSKRKKKLNIWQKMDEEGNKKEK